MSRLKFNRKASLDYLKSACPQMAGLIREKGAFKLKVTRNSDLFVSLSGSIAYQQLSGKAAATIYGRFENLFENNIPSAEVTTGLPVARLRSVGLSNSKALSIIDLAERLCSGSLPSPRKLATLDDEAIIESLCQVRGIGPWTAQMHLIFAMGRPDVMPSTDLGIQKGVQIVYNLAALPSPDEVMATTQHLSPYRSVASWYLWRVVDD